MHCIKCGNKLSEDSKFCGKCGAGVDLSPTPTESRVSVIKCGNCDYIGPGEPARSKVAMVLAWLCVLFAPLITIIYFVATHKYRCPKCKSTFLGIKGKDGNFSANKGGSRSPVFYILMVLVGIAIIGIIASVILASLNTAREKGKAAQELSMQSNWTTYTSVSDKFSVLFPTFPELDSESNIPTDADDLSYQWKSFTSENNNAIFYVFKYIYSDEIDISDKDVLLEAYLNTIINSDTNNILNDSRYSYYLGYRSLDFTLKNGQKYIDGKFVLVGQTPYLLMMEYVPYKNSINDYSKFINSFKLN